MYVYILRTRNNKLYIGHTNNLRRRMIDHKNAHAAKYIKDHGDFDIAYYEKLETRKEAMARERQIKKWRRDKKEALISKDYRKLKSL